MSKQKRSALSAAKHTPRPWTVLNDGIVEDDKFIASPHSQGCVAKVFHGVDVGNVTANAALIAAAPELLNSLKRLMGYIENAPFELSDDIQIDMDLAQLAIAKAEGEKNE